jgi:type II secretory ATPase GspE/PulE/Tfp pilus assembly ATPase PilB-like protein
LDTPSQTPSDLAAPGPEEIALLSRVDIFEALPDELKQELAMRLMPRQVKAGELLFREGSEGDALFIIKKGSVLVFNTDATFGLTCELARLGPGQAFGEMALVSDAPRSASVKALDDLSLLVLSSGDFLALVHKAPGVGLMVAGVLAQRLDKLNHAQGVQFGSLRSQTYNEEVASLIPTHMIQRHRMLPIERAGRTVTLATPDPGNLLGLDDIRRVLRGMEIRLLAVSEADWATFLGRHGLDGGGAARGAPAARPAARPTPAARPGLVPRPGAEGPAARTSRLRYRRTQTLQLDERRAGVTQVRGVDVSEVVSQIFIEAIDRSASDILIEPEAHGVTVRFRVHGELKFRQGEIPIAVLPALISRIKVLAGMDITERRLPQDGRISLTVDGQNYDLRLSTIATHNGERVGIRVLDASKLGQGLDSLILARNVAYTVRNLMFQPNGLVLITGPTGSGKTTTLYSAIRERNVPELSICTVEDPIEYDLAGISQVQINDDIGLNWTTVLKTFLRQNPDIILVGETRDAATAKMACNAALTGHLVLTSFHTNDAVSAVVRLMGMGVEPYVLASCLQGVVNQRLVLRLCPECARPHSYPDVVYRNLAHAGVQLEAGATLHRATGCDACFGTGYAGQVGAYEVLVSSPELRAAIGRQADGQELEAAIPDGTYMPMARYVSFLLAHGLTTPEEVIRIMPGEEEDR